MSHQEIDRIQELERRVGQLTTVVIVQSVALVLALVRFAPIAALGFVLLLPILAFTHHRIPTLARKCGRLLSFLNKPLTASANPSSTDGSKSTI